jgi:hypothetical protein
MSEPIRTVLGTVRREPGVPLPVEGDACFFRYVPTDDVPEHHRKRVRKHVDRAARDLQYPAPIKVRYYRHVATRTPPFPGAEPIGTFHSPDRPPPYDFAGPATATGELFLGMVDAGQPDTIALNRGLRGVALAAVVAHEVRHLAQLRKGATDEQDAEVYASSYVRRLGVA